MHRGNTDVKRQGKIFIVIGIVALLLLIGWAAASIIQKQKSKNQVAQTDARLIDKNKTIGADKIISSRQVVEAFKGLGKDVHGPHKSGVLVAEKNSQGEAVTYPMKTVKKNVTATLHVNKFIYTDTETLKKNLPFEESRGEAVEGVGDMARYMFIRPVAADWQAVVMVVKDKTLYTFTLIQNYNEGIGITETAAKQALVSLAKNANYGK